MKVRSEGVFEEDSVVSNLLDRMEEISLTFWSEDLDNKGKEENIYQFDYLDFVSRFHVYHSVDEGSLGYRLTAHDKAGTTGILGKYELENIGTITVDLSEVSFEDKTVVRLRDLHGRLEEHFKKIDEHRAEAKKVEIENASENYIRSLRDLSA
jgi:hypothetical protein